MKSLITTTPVLLCAGLLATGTGAAQQPSPLQEKSLSLIHI